MYAQKCLLGVWPGSFPGGKESACNARNLGSIPGFGKSTREGKGYPLQYSGLENSMDCIVPWGHKESDMTEQVSLHFTGPGRKDSMGWGQGWEFESSHAGGVRKL